MRLVIRDAGGALLHEEENLDLEEVGDAIGMAVSELVEDEPGRSLRVLVDPE